MKSDQLRRAIGGIDEDLIEAADSAVTNCNADNTAGDNHNADNTVGDNHNADNIAEKRMITSAEEGRSENLNPKKRRSPMVLILRYGSVAAVLLLLLTGAFLFPGIIKKLNPATDPGQTSPISGGGNKVADPGENAVVKTLGGENLVLRGELITDEEAAAYLAENKTSILSSLSENGVEVSNAEISERGYCHIIYSDSAKKDSELIRYLKEYPVYNNGKLVAVVMLRKEDGELWSVSSFGSPSYASYGNYLNTHKGQELIYIYSGNDEIILAPDGNHFVFVGAMGNNVHLTPGEMGLGSQLSTKGIYERFYYQGAVFVP